MKSFTLIRTRTLGKIHRGIMQLIIQRAYNKDAGSYIKVRCIRKLFDITYYRGEFSRIIRNFPS